MGLEMRLLINCHTESPATTDAPTTTTIMTTTIHPQTDSTSTESATNLTMTEDISTTATEDVRESDTPQTTNGRSQPTAIDSIEVATYSQNTATGGLMAAAVVGGVLIGVLITLLPALIVVAIVRVRMKNRSTLTLTDVNRTTQGMDRGEETMNDIDTKAIEEPVYSEILLNPSVNHCQVVDMNVNECYSTTRGNQCNSVYLHNSRACTYV